MFVNLIFDCLLFPLFFQQKVRVHEFYCLVVLLKFGWFISCIALLFNVYFFLYFGTLIYSCIVVFSVTNFSKRLGISTLKLLSRLIYNTSKQSLWTSCSFSYYGFLNVHLLLKLSLFHHSCWSSTSLVAIYTMIAGSTSKSNIHEARLHGDDNYGMSVEFTSEPLLFAFDSHDWDYWVASYWCNDLYVSKRFLLND